MDNTQKLLETAAGIRDAVLDGENTAFRVGAMFVSIIQAIQHFPGQMIDASTIEVTNGKDAIHISFKVVDSAGEITQVDIPVPAASSTTAGLLTPEQLEKYNTDSEGLAAIKKRMPGAEKGLLLSGFRHGPTDEGVSFVFDAIGADGTIVPQQILVPLVSAGSPGVVTKVQMDAVTTAAEEAKTAAHGASVAAQEAQATASQAKNTAEGAATTADAAKTAADGAAKGVRDINAVVGEPDGIATLDTNGKVPVEQVPALGYLPLTKVVGVDTQAHIEESIGYGYTGAGLYFVTDYNYGEGAFCKVTVTAGADGAVTVDFDDDGAQPSDAALEGYFLATSTGKLWQMEQGELVEVPTRQALAAKQDAIVASEEIVPQSGNKLGLTERAKLALFVDIWNTLTSGYGGYKPEQAPDAEHPFMLNEVWLTYKEAIVVVSKNQTWGTETVDYVWADVKTNIPIWASSSRIYRNSFNGMVVANLRNIHVQKIHACLNGEGLKKVLNFDAEFMNEQKFRCFDAPNLEVLDISNMKIGLDLSKCPLINLASWQGLIQRAANTTGITVTVHPDVYAKVTGDTTNVAAAALSADELAQWQALVAAAAAKNITFKTEEQKEI